jgi:hypothetical protein
LRWTRITLLSTTLAAHAVGCGSGEITTAVETTVDDAGNVIPIDAPVTPGIDGRPGQIDARPTADAPPQADAPLQVDGPPQVDARPVADAHPVADARPVVDARPLVDARPPVDAAPQPDAGPGPGPGPLDLCDGLVTDKQPRPMTDLPKPAVGQAVVDAEFGTTIRRITAVPQSGANPAIRPLYSTVASWNADETRLILYRVGSGHQLYDGKSYAFIRALDISAADIEQVYWHTTDPDILFYVDGRNFIRYHVGSGTRETVTTFSFCGGDASAGSDPMYISFDSRRIGLGCGGQAFLYDIEQNQVLSQRDLGGNPPQIAPSGRLLMNTDNGQILDTAFNLVHTVDLREPYGHASLGRLPNGDDTWNGVVFDPGPRGNDDIGTLVTWNITRNTSRVIIGEATGWPYPKTTHVSAVAIRQPGWVVVSSFGDLQGRGLLDLELLVANTDDGAVCRVGRHRSWGKENTQLGDPYWAEAHAAFSPSGTRAVFASDWGNGATVDAYVLELPSYTP